MSNKNKDEFERVLSQLSADTSSSFPKYFKITLLSLAIIIVGIFFVLPPTETENPNIINYPVQLELELTSHLNPISQHTVQKAALYLQEKLLLCDVLIKRLDSGVKRYLVMVRAEDLKKIIPYLSAAPPLIAIPVVNSSNGGPGEIKF